MKTHTFILLIGIVFLLGCSSPASYRASELNTMIGSANKASCVAMYGMPDKTLDLGQSEIWEYCINEHKYTSDTGYRFSTYEQMRLIFKGGLLSDWSIEKKVD